MILIKWIMSVNNHSTNFQENFLIVTVAVSTKHDDTDKNNRNCINDAQTDAENFATMPTSTFSHFVMRSSNLNLTSTANW
jgi:hypothetical protein